MSSYEEMLSDEINREYSFRMRFTRAAELALAGNILWGKELLVPGGRLSQTG